ncbi:alpha-L-fucosidase [Maribacter sp. HTCC2170]|uniref:alpha-L-fucosidase n=1 Tax=Maribacter sp. (strain HTCC2170 / KCCM 42371) TaxID=313603 RepID=UPI00006BE0B6|nr:alpha-L-fucosidase [Maribacter sp. HTCC2170]EAQ99989.1 putative alpha-L-fucosidase [Maribacter sp. HTCC2170]
MGKYSLLFCFSLFMFGVAMAQTNENNQRLDWFEDAKLGVFIHWGYYGVNGITESWSLYHKRIAYDDYMAQGKKFTAANYDPNKWAQLFKKIGADYVVMTTKHHDGVALWDTKLSHLNVLDKTPAKRDLVAPYVDALRANGLKVGLYYSLCDWSHPDYDVVFPRPNTKKNYPQKGQKKMDAWERFVLFNQGQMRELSSQFNPDLYWFDGDWEKSAEQWRSKALKDSLLKWNPNVIVNSRLNQYGDYKTPEQGVPVVRPEGPWEFCMTMNDNWGYYPSDTNYKPISQIVRTFVEVISKGGNMLLNIGPKPDGTIAAEQLERLETLGTWINKHKTAVKETTAGLPYGHFFGPTLLSKDKKKIYLCLFDEPKNFIQLKGIQNKVTGIKVLGSDEELTSVRNGGAAWNNIPGILRISLPKNENLDKYVTIVEVSLEDELVLYRGHGNAVELNN